MDITSSDQYGTACLIIEADDYEENTIHDIIEIAIERDATYYDGEDECFVIQFPGRPIEIYTERALTGSYRPETNVEAELEALRGRFESLGLEVKIDKSPAGLRADLALVVPTVGLSTVGGQCKDYLQLLFESGNLCRVDQDDKWCTWQQGLQMARDFAERK